MTSPCRHNDKLQELKQLPASVIRLFGNKGRTCSGT